MKANPACNHCWASINPQQSNPGYNNYKTRFRVRATKDMMKDGCRAMNCGAHCAVVALRLRVPTVSASDTCTWACPQCWPWARRQGLHARTAPCGGGGGLHAAAAPTQLRCLPLGLGQQQQQLAGGGPALQGVVRATRLGLRGDVPQCTAGEAAGG